MGKADLHIHTSASDGMFSANDLLEYVEHQTDLDVIAVTEHDDIRGSMRARDLWARGDYRFDIVTGEEVTTIEGHLLALFIESPVPSLKPLPETVEAIRRQGGICIAPHPFSWLARGLSERHIRRCIKDGPGLEGIEVMNSTPAGVGGRHRALRLSRELGIPEAGGSDAHFLGAVGSGITHFDGVTATELRASISHGTTRGVAGRHPSLARLGLPTLLRQTYRGICSTPRALGWGPTALSFVRRIVAVR